MTWSSPPQHCSVLGHEPLGLTWWQETGGRWTGCNNQCHPVRRASIGPDSTPPQHTHLPEASRIRCPLPSTPSSPRQLCAWPLRIGWSCLHWLRRWLSSPVPGSGAGHNSGDRCGLLLFALPVQGYKYSDANGKCSRPLSQITGG